MGKKYKPGKRIEPLQFEITIIDGEGDLVTAQATAEPLTYKAYHGLTAEARQKCGGQEDVTGEKEMARTRYKLRRVLTRLADLDESVGKNGVLEGAALAAFLDDSENDDLVWVGWAAYEGALSSPSSKSGDRDSGNADGKARASLREARAPA